MCFQKDKDSQPGAEPQAVILYSKAETVGHSGRLYLKIKMKLGMHRGVEALVSMPRMRKKDQGKKFLRMTVNLE